MRKKVTLASLEDLESRLQSEARLHSEESSDSLSQTIKQLQVQLQAETDARIALEKRLDQEIRSRKIFEDKVREILESLHRKIQAQSQERPPEKLTLT